MSEKSKGKVLVLGMAGAAAAGLYLWWKNRAEQGLTGELIPEQPIIFPENGGGGWPDLYIPEWPAFPEPHPLPENGEEQQPIYINVGGGGIPSGGGFVPIPPTTIPFPETTPTAPTQGFLQGVSPDVGVVKYAVYPSDILDPNLMDPITRTVYESGRATGFFIKNTYNKIKDFMGMEIFPSVEAAPAPAPKPPATERYPTPLPSVTTPEGFISTPTELGYMPSILAPSYQQPVAPQPPAPIPTITPTPYDPYKKPSWLGG